MLYLSFQTFHSSDYFIFRNEKDYCKFFASMYQNISFGSFSSLVFFKKSMTGSNILVEETGGTGEPKKRTRKPRIRMGRHEEVNHTLFDTLPSHFY